MNKKQQILYVIRSAELVFPTFNRQIINSDDVGSLRLGVELAKILLRTEFELDDWTANRAASKAWHKAYFAYENEVAYTLVHRNSEEWALREAQAIRQVYAYYASKAACQAYIACQLDVVHPDGRADIVYSAIIRAVQLTRSRGRVSWKPILEIGINILKGK